VPIACVAGSESPDYPFGRYALLHLSIVGYVDIVIIVDELVISHLPIYEEHSGNENKANASFSPHDLDSFRAMAEMVVKLSYQTTRVPDQPEHTC